MNTTDLHINAAEMRDPIVIGEPNRSTEPTLGERMISWRTWKRWWCELKPASGIEIERAKAVSASVSHVLIMRWCNGLKPDMRITVGGNVLQINAVIDVLNRKVKHVVYCTQVVEV